MVRVDAAVQNHLREGGDIACGGEQSGVAGDSAHGPGIFVVNFAPDEPLAEGRVVFRGSDSSRSLRGGLNMELFIPSGVENVLLRE